MAQDDLNVVNGSGATVRGKINTALQALGSTSKGNTRPATVYAGQQWLDDNTPSGTLWTLYLWDGADDIPIVLVDSSANGVTYAAQDGAAGTPSHTFFSDQDTGMFHVGANTLGFATGGTQAFQIDSGGNIQVNATSAPEPTKYLIKSDTSVAVPLVIQNSQSGTSDSACIKFYRGAASVGNISVTGSVVNYNTSSDYRLKQNLAAIPDPLAKLAALKTYEGEYKAMPGVRVPMFLAHELQEVVPNAVTGVKDEHDAELRPVYQGVDHSKLVPLLTAALQAAVAQIDALTARVAALEAR